MNLTALREIEPTPEEIARVRERAERPAPPARRRRPLLAVAAVTALAAATTALPGPDGAATALRAAAAAAADQPAPRDFSGYRHVEVLERRDASWATYDEACMRRFTQRLEEGTQRGNRIGCPVTARATYTEEGRHELWVDAAWSGVRRDHGSRVVAAEGDPELVAQLRGERARTPATYDYVYGEGPFARAPLADLPTEPAALLRTLSAAYEDGRWAEGGRLATSDPARHDYALASYIAHLLAEANATPALRSAAFGALARTDGFTDLGTVRDATGREGRGIRISGRSNAPEGGPATLELIFDPDRGELLSWSERSGGGGVERVLVRTGHVREAPGSRG